MTREQADREEQERLARETAERAQQEQRLAQEHEEKERLAREQAEHENAEQAKSVQQHPVTSLSTPRGPSTDIVPGSYTYEQLQTKPQGADVRKLEVSYYKCRRQCVRVVT